MEINIENILEKIQKNGYYDSLSYLKHNDYFNELLLLSPEEKKEIISSLIEYILNLDLDDKGLTGKHFVSKLTSRTIIRGFLKDNLNYNEQEWISLYQNIIENALCDIEILKFLPILSITNQLEFLLKKKKASNELIKVIKKTLCKSIFVGELIQEKPNYDLLVKSRNKLNNILINNNETKISILNNEDIGSEVNNLIHNIDEKLDLHVEIFMLASEARQSKPSKKFQSTVKLHIQKIGEKSFIKMAHQILLLALNFDFYLKTHHWCRHKKKHIGSYMDYLSDSNEQFIKGVVWTVEGFSDKKNIKVLEKLFYKSQNEVPGEGTKSGTASLDIGVACVQVLGNMKSKDALEVLSSIKLKQGQNKIHKIINVYLNEGVN